MSPLLLREEDFSQTGTPTPDPKSPVERRVGTDRHPYLPYDVIATPEAVTPVAVESLPSSPPPPAQGADRGKGVEIHGIKGNIVGVSNDGTPSGSAKQHSSQPAPTPELASSHWNPGEGIKLEGPMAKIVETSNVGTASSSVEQPAANTHQHRNPLLVVGILVKVSY
ncbi:hypothetical protein BJV74DRAFT_486629 [Russula compacta]|nr:hypothetical protein BJV74DRAFT_486629 [Russula compacta]